MGFTSKLQGTAGKPATQESSLDVFCHVIFDVTILRLFKIIVLLSNGNWSAPAYGGNYLKTKRT